MSLTDQILCIDVAPLIVDEPDEEALKSTLAQIDIASRRFGFFNIINHGVDPNLMKRIEDITRLFFQLPEEVKKSFSRSVTNMRGYFDGEYTKNARDWKQGFDWGGYDNPVDGNSLWPLPDILPEFREILLEYWHAMSRLGGSLLKGFCLLLGVPGDHLSGYFELPHPSWARLNYYPTCPNVTTELGISPHRDAACLTILKQDDNVSGLQVYDKSGDESVGDGLQKDDPNWVTVPPVPGAFTINLGEVLQVWSNDRYFAALHRVLAQEDERYSIPYFYQPRYDTTIEPLVKDGQKPKYRPLDWGEFRQKRIIGDYQKLDFKDQGRLPNWRI